MKKVTGIDLGSDRLISLAADLVDVHEVLHGVLGFIHILFRGVGQKLHNYAARGNAPAFIHFNAYCNRSLNLLAHMEVLHKVISRSPNISAIVRAKK